MPLLPRGRDLHELDAVRIAPGHERVDRDSDLAPRVDDQPEALDATYVHGLRTLPTAVG
jgi:hypothetical protein